MNRIPDLRFSAQYRFDPAHVPSQADELAALFQFREHLKTLSPHFADWYLGGDSPAKALLYSAFDDNGPTTALVAVLREKERTKRKNDLVTVRTVGLWNGQEDENAASLGLVFRDRGGPCLVHLQNDCPDIFVYDKALSIIQEMVRIWHPAFVSAAPFYYDAVFKDRPGVGWMLYLPQVLTARQVPEARALVPVLGADKKQIGTIVVSVTDAPFSKDNPEHVKIANAIEVRLVDQDLLPRYVDL